MGEIYVETAEMDPGFSFLWYRYFIFISVADPDPSGGSVIYWPFGSGF